METIILLFIIAGAFMLGYYFGQIDGFIDGYKRGLYTN